MITEIPKRSSQGDCLRILRYENWPGNHSIGKVSV